MFSANGKLHMLRWQKKHWVITDLRPNELLSENKFDESRWLYAVESDADIPPLTGWFRRGSAPVPTITRGATASDVLNIMQSLAAEAEVQAAAIAAVWVLADGGPEIATPDGRLLAEGHAHSLVLSAMLNHPTEADVQAEGCHALHILGLDQYVGIADAIVAEDGLAALLAAMKNHAEQPNVAGWACGALKSVSYSSNKNMMQVTQSGAVHAMVKAMAAHSSVELVQEHGSGCLLNLLAPDEKGDRTAELESSICEVGAEILETNGVTAMIAAMRAHPTAAKIQRYVCSALIELMDAIRFGKGNEMEIEEAPEKYTVGWLSAYQKLNLKSIRTTALWGKQRAQAKQVAGVAKAENVVGLIATALIKHPDERGVQEHGEEALDLLDPKPTDEEQAAVRDSHCLLFFQRWHCLLARRCASR